MMVKSKDKGFSTIEFIFCTIVLALFYSGVVLAVSMGNFYFTERGVLKDIQVDHPEVVKVLKTGRNIIRYSTLTVENKDGSKSTYQLDTNIFFNYRAELVK